MEKRIASNAAEARMQLETMLLAAVKARSIGYENCGDDKIGQEMLEHLQPWLYGAKNVVPHLERLLDQDDEISASDYEHFMFIALKLEPAISVASVAMGQVDLPLYDDLPELLKVRW